MPLAPAGAATSELVVADRLTGVALYGFDPVCYFLHQDARAGSEQFELSFSGLTWRFRNENNRAAFLERPEAYVPQFGGYDPVALTRGAPVAGHPGLFAVRDGRVYLFHDSENRGAFLAQPDRTIKAAHDAWPNVRRSLVP